MIRESPWAWSLQKHKGAEAAKLKSVQELKYLPPQLYLKTDFIENEHSKIQNFYVASSQLLQRVSLEWKLSEIHQPNELNSSF